MQRDQLLPAESRLLDCVRGGNHLDLTADDPDGDRRIRAAVLRCLLFTLPLPDGTVVQDPIPRLALRGASIVGRLDLADAVTSGGGIGVSLILEDCLIPEPVEMSNCRLGRLSLAGCQLTHLRANGIVLDGSLDLSRVGPYRDSAGVRGSGT